MGVISAYLRLLFCLIDMLFCIFCLVFDSLLASLLRCSLKERFGRGVDGVVVASVLLRLSG